MKYTYEKEALTEHDRLSRLFRENRFMFELERKKLIEKQINQYPVQKQSLTELQARWDSRLKHAGSAHNRFVLMQTLFWDEIVGHWLPALQHV